MKQIREAVIVDYVRTAFSRSRPREPEKDFFGNMSVPMKKMGKMIVPSFQEIKENNRARSAKLRIATLK